MKRQYSQNVCEHSMVTLFSMKICTNRDSCPPKLIHIHAHYMGEFVKLFYDLNLKAFPGKLSHHLNSKDVNSTTVRILQLVALVPCSLWKLRMVMLCHPSFCLTQFRTKIRYFHSLLNNISCKPFLVDTYVLFLYVIYFRNFKDL